MPMDPELADVFEQLAVFNLPSITTMEPAEVRAAGSMVDVEDAEAAIAMAEWAELEVPGGRGPLAARRYRAVAGSHGGAAVPTIVWLHGGGWVLGDLDGAELVCRSMARDTGAVVLSVAYSLAPEHRFPAAIEDAVAALGWAADHADDLGGVGGPLVIGGDSAGGNLAAVVSRLARDAGGPSLAAQVLVYPSTDLVGDYPSRHANADGPVLTAADGEWFARHYLGPDADTLVADPRASPLLAPDLGGLPPAVVAVGEYDLLHDEGLAYAEALGAAGCRVVVVDTPGMIHGYASFITVSRAAADALRAVAAALLSLLD